MTTCSMSFRNIKKSIKDYAIYFFTLMLGVCLFYVFNSIETQTTMLALSKDSRDTVKLLVQMINTISVFVAFVLGFLIIYASRFMLKRRSGEFALYLILGMSKRKVARILFAETLMIGCLSLIGGLLLGVFTSQITSVFVGKLFEANMTKYAFIFSMKAFRKTCLYFALIYVVVIIFNTLVISCSKLIRLMQVKRRNERTIRIHPAISVIGFLLSIGILGYAYRMVCFDLKYISSESLSFAILLGVIGTFLLFWSLAGLLLKFASLAKGIYYKGLNSFTFRQLASQANTNVVAMSVICLMFFFTICVLISSVNIKTGMNRNIKKYCPADLEIAMDWEGTDANRMKTLKEDIAERTEDSLTFPIYRGGFLMSMKGREVVVDPKFKPVRKDGWYSYSISDVMEVSTYNEVAKYFGNQPVHLADDEYTIVSNYHFTSGYFNEILSKGQRISFDGKKELKPGTKTSVEGSYQISTNADNFGIVIVPDGYCSEKNHDKEMILVKYPSLERKERAAFEKELLTTVRKDLEDHYIYDTKTALADSSIGLAAFAVFIALYIGCIFLISGAAILAIKELSDSADNKERYAMLRKLGADDAMIHKALFRQMAIFFLMPLILAVIHSVPGMIFARKILEELSGGPLLPAVLVTIAIFGSVYGCYFLITYFTSKRMIKE